MVESRLTLLPSLLIAIAGVLVDATFRSDDLRDRAWAQIALWLAASLQADRSNEDETTFTTIWIHAAFFMSLASASYQAFLIQCRWNVSSSMQSDYSRFLAPCMVFPLIYSWTYLVPPKNIRSAWLECCLLFLSAFLCLCGWRWTTLRRRRVHQDLVGIPIVESLPVYTSTRSLEERLWMEWTPSEVLTWIQSLEGEEWSSVCSQLAPERIPGCVLDILTVAELRSIGLPFGPAQCLVDKIQDLTREYPSSTQRTSRYRDPYQEELELDGWLGNGREASSRGKSRETDSTTSVDELHVESKANESDFASTSAMIPEELNEEAIRKAKELFREQFGLELPEMKARPSVANGLQVTEEGGRYSQDMPATLSEPPAATIDVTTSDNRDAVEFPPDLLDSMPPHVREVAEQRPDLVQMLWNQRREGKSATALGLSRIHQLRMQDPAYAQRFLGGQVAAEMAGLQTASNDANDSADSSEDNLPDQNDGERTGLLRKRSARPPQYAAIR